MISDKQLLEQALEAINATHPWEKEAAITAIRARLEQPEQERNFCERCGKRLGGEGHIHTCTPPAAPYVASPRVQEPVAGKRLELIGHADLAINNIYVFNGYGEEVPDGRTPIYAGYPAPAAPVQEPVAWMGTDIEGNPNKFRLNAFDGGTPLYKTPQSVNVWDAEGYDSLMQEMQMVKARNIRQHAEIERLSALVRAQQITIDKLEKNI